MATELSLSGIVEALEQNLKREKTALLSGAFGEIGEILAEKERLGALLDRALLDKARAAQFPAYRKRLAALVTAAAENEGLLTSAKAGVVSAHARIKDILNRRQTVGVYEESGGKLLSPGAGVSKQKYA